MDKSWINLQDRVSLAYCKGCLAFLDFAFANNGGSLEIQCPCTKCLNRYYLDRDNAFDHIICNGFDTDYVVWVTHGESFDGSKTSDNENQNYNVDEEMIDMIHDAIGGVEGLNSSSPDEESKEFYRLLEDAEKPFYPGCKKFTTLSFLVQLLNLKVLYGWSDISFSKLLELLKEAFPDGETLPKSYFMAKKFFSSLGFSYKKIDACPNNCMLYWKEKEGLESCDVCKTPRYHEIVDQTDDGKTKSKQIPKKRMRYFPLKPRLRRLFRSSKTAALMRWHAEERDRDGIQRHPADSLAWKTFDELHPEFADDRRNVRFGLASDGFSPYRTIGIPYSTWPVLLIIYNFPPWLCMKQSSFILSILIDGPDAPGNDIDVYLQPLIEELRDLWIVGLRTYDADSKEMFQLYATLMWTINDFPAYANLSGWSTRGEYACPPCNKDTDSRWLKNSHKYCYAGHRRFLEMDHKFRKDVRNFYDKKETREKPRRLSGEEILKQVENIQNKFGKLFKPPKRKRSNSSSKRSNGGSKRSNGISKRSKGSSKTSKGSSKRSKDSSNVSPAMPYNWRKKSIFFELPYWKDNLIHHNLDVMHIEKNVCESIVYTLLGDARRTKDGVKARKDLKDMRIRKPLHPQACGNGQSKLPPASFTMSNEEKVTFCTVLKGIKVPDNYSSNISKCVKVKERTIRGLKSHDCHVLMQELLPIAIRKVLPSNVGKTLVELCNFFKKLCSKVLTESDIDEMEEQIKLTICSLEKIFPPSFFDDMMHLPVHLAEEARIAGLVLYRWMYPIERYLLTLKKYVRQRNYPEGSIAEGYIAEECLTFCSRYLDDDVETKINRPARYTDGGNGKEERFTLDPVEREQAHRYILTNTESIDPFRDMHLKVLEEKHAHTLTDSAIKKKHMDEFPYWLEDHVRQSMNDPNLSDEVKFLSKGPSMYAIRYKKGYTINGLKFHTMSYGARKKSQNSGVMLDTTIDNVISGDVKYYGRLTDVIQVSYSMDMKFDLFKCIWVDNRIGKREDEYKFTLVNFNHLLYRQNLATDEPFILASQAQQVWYVSDPVDPNWNVVRQMRARDVYDMQASDITSPLSCPATESYSQEDLIVDDQQWVRTDIDGTVIADDCGGEQDTNYDEGDDVQDEVGDDGQDEVGEDDDDDQEEVGDDDDDGQDEVGDDDDDDDDDEEDDDGQEDDEEDDDDDEEDDDGQEEEDDDDDDDDGDANENEDDDEWQ